MKPAPLPALKFLILRVMKVSLRRGSTDIDVLTIDPLTFDGGLVEAERSSCRYQAGQSNPLSIAGIRSEWRISANIRIANVSIGLLSGPAWRRNPRPGQFGFQNGVHPQR